MRSVKPSHGIPFAYFSVMGFFVNNAPFHGYLLLHTFLCENLFAGAACCLNVL